MSWDFSPPKLLVWYIAPCFSSTTDPDTGDPLPPGGEFRCPSTGGAAHCPSGMERIHAYCGVTGTCLVGFSPGCEGGAGADWVSKTLQQAQTIFTSFYGRAPTEQEVF